jgi:hypothetical protein
MMFNIISLQIQDLSGEVATRSRGNGWLRANECAVKGWRANFWGSGVSRLYLHISMQWNSVCLKKNNKKTE